MTTQEPEITAPVDLCRSDGRLNLDAVGWSRTPVHRANLRGWGRTKRWEYWCITSPTHAVALTVSDLDFLALNSVYILQYARDDEPATEYERAAIVPFGRGVELPEGIAGSGGPHGADVAVGSRTPGRRKVRISISSEAGGTRLRAQAVTADGRPLDLDLLASLPAGHETLSVVVPWSERRFQYTSKQTARPASGSVRIGGRVLEFGNDAWATLDHGRGRWPRSITWNWGAASGVTAGRVVGLQFGGKWTDGTGSTENALCVDGRLSKIGEDVEWDYDSSDFLKPWKLRTPGSGQVDLTFTPFHDHRTRTEAGLLATKADQCFGHYSGQIRTDDGDTIDVDHLLGWAEEVHMRW